METQEPDWQALIKRYPKNVVESLERHFSSGPFRLSAHQLAIEANSTDELASSLLEYLVTKGLLRTGIEYLCPCERRIALSAEDASAEVCTQCGRAFEVDVAGRPIPNTILIRDAPETRDVRWMLALHGMNTTGAWQETFNWLLARIYFRSVPVAIYKYGIVLSGAILKFRQRMLMRRLQERIRTLSRDTAESGFGGVPDVIAHSFGTWLLGHALVEDATLRVGRVILTGCILRPDFDWPLLFERKQVEAVLCHVATRDCWARIAHYVIPDSGPSGRRGFNSRTLVSHALLVDGHHSDFFGQSLMPNLFNTLWQPFLTQPLSEPATANGLPAPNWKQACWPLRATLLRIALLALIGAILAFGVTALGVGSVSLWKLSIR